VIRKQLRPNQAEAVQRWKDRLADGFGLFDEQRVGKNLPALAIVDHEKPARLLIITLKKGIKVWQKEIAESLALDWPCEIQIINFNQVERKSTFRKLKLWLAGDTSFMIVDEAQHIKRRGSKWSRRCRLIGRKADHRLALTGTPIAQGIWDAWAIFDYLGPSIFGKWAITQKKLRPGQRPIIQVVSGFQHRYLLMDPFWRSKVIGTQNEEEFYQVFHAHSIRHTLAEVRRRAGLKPARIRRVVLTEPLSDAERRSYIELEKELVTVVNRRRIETPLAMTLTMKLQQICGGFVIDEDGVVHELGNTKLRLLLLALGRLTKKDRPLVICRFLHELEAIARVLDFAGYSVKRIQGGIDFDPNEKIKETAIVLQIQSGVAIDLAIANVAIFYSWDFSYINHEQSRFRILQYISTRVSYYYLVMKGTIDELILEAVLRKKRLADLVCDHYRRR
jgi:hypothetical protein